MQEDSVNVEDLEAMRRRRKQTDPYEELLDASQAGASEPSDSGELGANDETSGPEAEDKSGASVPQADLLAAYKGLQQQLAAVASQMNDFRNILGRIVQDRSTAMQQADESSAARNFRDRYRDDPAAAVLMMVQDSKNEIWNAVQNWIADVLSTQRQARRFFDDLFDDPQFAGLKPYERELEHLIFDKHLHPKEAAALLRQIQSKGDKASRMRSALASDIRNRSAMETSGDEGETTDKDADFEKMIKKAKTLDEMFDGLRKFRA